MEGHGSQDQSTKEMGRDEPITFGRSIEDVLAFTIGQVKKFTLFDCIKKRRVLFPATEENSSLTIIDGDGKRGIGALLFSR